jgi:hypothetical protein
MPDEWGELVLAAGALGTAAFGIVEGLKWIPLVGEAGFTSLLKLLGRALQSALRVAYGDQFERMLRAQYRGDQEDLTTVLRQGMRIGLTPKNAENIALELGVVEPARLTEAAVAVETGAPLTAEQRNAIARFELAADARVDAALSLAQDHYKRLSRFLAGVVAVALAIFAAYVLAGNWSLLGKAVLIGIAAVPLAPVAKDVAGALKAATEALRAKT